MDYIPDVRVRRHSPQARRQRRLAQQQSRCCGCFLVVLCLVLGIIAGWAPLAHWRQHRQEIRQARSQQVNYFPVQLQTEHGQYYRYSLVKIILTLSDSRGQHIETEDPPKITVLRGGKVVETVADISQVTPSYDKRGERYICRWPVPWNAPAGRYTAMTRYKIKNPAAWRWETMDEEIARKRRDGDDEPLPVDGEAFCVARTSFVVLNRKPTPIPPGLCAATWEEDLPGPGARMKRPSGGQGDWKTLLEWCEFIGADTLWVRGALTRAGEPAPTIQRPFVQANLDAIPRFAAEAHRRGIKFGAWAMAYETLPQRTNEGKPPYKFTQDVSRSRNEIADTSFVSLLDERREAAIVRFCKDMQADPNVDFVGLDYIRTEPGYELADLFAAQMPVDLPSDWEQMSQVAKWKYVAQRAEGVGVFQHPNFYEAWNWYRAHLGAELVSRIIRKAGLRKPLWLFMLTWKHGEQHGQDPYMFADAGVAMLAPMLYQVETRRHYEFILDDWHAYTQPGKLNLICGDQVDNDWHQDLGPEELQRRMTQAHERFVNGGHTSGGFWHDISRAAVVGRLGPYPPSEWALAGGASFSRIRTTWGVYPIQAELQAPTTARLGGSFRLTVKLANVSDKPVRHIKIKPMSTLHVSFDRPTPRQVALLRPGETLTVPFQARITQDSPVRRNRFAAAFRVTWPAGNYGKKLNNDLPPVIILMTDKYIQVG